MNDFPKGEKTNLGAFVDYCNFLAVTSGATRPEFKEFVTPKYADLFEYILEKEKELNIVAPKLGDLITETNQLFRESKESKLQDRYANHVLNAYKDIWSSYKLIIELQGEIDLQRSELVTEEESERILKGQLVFDETPDQKELRKSSDSIESIRCWVWNVLNRLRYSLETFAPELFQLNWELFYKLPYIDEQFCYYWKTPDEDEEPQPAQTQPTEPGVKKPRKKEKLTHKGQMVLVEVLGLAKHPLLQNLTPKQKGVVIGELLNRSVDDTENMLNPETSKTDPKLDWDTEYYRAQVCSFLKEQGVNLSK